MYRLFFLPFFSSCIYLFLNIHSFVTFFLVLLTQRYCANSMCVCVSLSCMAQSISERLDEAHSLCPFIQPLILGPLWALGRQVPFSKVSFWIDKHIYMSQSWLIHNHNNRGLFRREAKRKSLFSQPSTLLSQYAVSGFALRGERRRPAGRGRPYYY